jgi:RNA polymerase sigma-70 factor (ECF subfamily)
MKDDLALVEEYKRGSISAFESLYKKYASKMKGVAFRYVNDSFIAEDVLQEAFVKVFNKIEKFDNTGPFEAWLRRIVVNTSINYYNSLKKENEKAAEFALSPENENADNTEEEELYSLKELMDAVNMLPSGYKIVFNMYAIDKYSHKEIAESLKITEGTSKSQLFKARDFLKKVLHNKKNTQNA